MLTIKCAACRRKLWKYEKLGQGEVLRCHKTRISKMYDVHERHGKVWCLCGKVIAIDKETFLGMVKGSFTYAGTKVTKASGVAKRR